MCFVRQKEGQSVENLSSSAVMAVIDGAIIQRPDHYEGTSISVYCVIQLLAVME